MNAADGAQHATFVDAEATDTRAASSLRPVSVGDTHRDGAADRAAADASTEADELRLRPSDLASTVIVGATSAIGRAIAEQLATHEPKARYVLVARRGNELERIAADLRIRRGVEVDALAIDVTAPDAATRLANLIADSPGKLRGAVLTQGVMTAQDDADTTPGAAERMIAVNFASVVGLIVALRPLIKPGGFIGVVSSVAGDRGRPSNFAYGSSKAGLNAYLDGLRGKLRGEPGAPTVTIVKPGFTDTAMTFGQGGMFLVAPPERVAKDAVRGIRNGASVVYTPGFWRLIMLIIRSIPRPIFDRLKL